jgi:L-iditol 2-dehydrogenase
MDKIPLTMQAVVYRGANDLRLETVPVPSIGRDEMLVQVAACGVCPTDIKKIAFGVVPPPRIFGHETSGVIVRLGAGVRKFKVGERVALHHHVPCLKCRACRHGAFAQCSQYKRTGITAGFEPAGGGYAEYVKVLPFVFPGVVRIPARNSSIEGAMLEPVNTVFKAIKRLSLLPGDNVLVAGQGPIGLLFTRLLKLFGANVAASDLLETRLKFARRLGAKWILQAGEPVAFHRLDESLGKQGLDAAVICTPSDAAVLQAQEMIRGAGKVLLFAHTRRGALTPLDLSSVCVDEKDLIGSYSSDFTLQAEVARLVFSRKLDVRPLITHQFPLAQTQAAIDLAAHPSLDSLKIMVGSAGESRP